MADQEVISSKIDAFIRLTRVLSEQRMFVRRAIVDKDGAGVGPWLIFKDGIVIDGGPLNDLVQKHAPH